MPCPVQTALLLHRWVRSYRGQLLQFRRVAWVYCPQKWKRSAQRLGWGVGRNIFAKVKEIVGGNESSLSTWLHCCDFLKQSQNSVSSNKIFSVKSPSNMHDFNTNRVRNSQRFPNYGTSNDLNGISSKGERDHTKHKNFTLCPTFRCTAQLDLFFLLWLVQRVISI